MAISEFEVKRCENELRKFMEKHRPPVHIRNELDFGYRIENQSVELFEIRPNWKDSSVKMEQGIAKTTFVKKDESWKVFWQRSDLKWHRYEPMPTVRFFEEFLELIAEDEHACFFG